ncbi:MAG: MATE family efflux transporter [Eubacteriales bacterium]|nr:MATE family efflux transporter [Eubacteriales bacterium]
MDHTKQLGTDPILKLVIKFSIPSIIAMSVNAIYNIVDRIFVGQFVGEDALGGLSIAFPLMMFTFAISALFGVGGSMLISIKFGERDFDQANKVFANLFMLSTISSAVMVTLGELFLPSLLQLVGATESVLPYAQEYMQIIFIGTFFQLSSFSMASLARSEGKPFLAMLSQLISAFINIVLDYIFIGPLGMGVGGAAIATVIGQVSGFSILVFYFFISKKSILKLRIANLRLKLSTVRQICSIGLPSFFINLGTSISASFSNIALAAYGGDAAITSMSAIHSLVTLVLMPILGIQQGIGPIMGYNHGMRQRKRVIKTLWTGIGFGAVFAVAMCCLMEIFPEVAASMFIDPESPTMAVCAAGLRIQAAGFPLLPISILTTAYLQSTTQSTKALALSLSRQGFSLIALLSLPPLLQLAGVWMSMTVGEALAVVLALCLLAYERHKYKNQLSNEPLSPVSS